MALLTSFPSSSLSFQDELDDMCNVEEARPLQVQTDAFKENVDNASRPEHTPAGLGLLLHHFFADRVLQLKWGLYLHTLRFARFCTTTAVIKANQDRYRANVEQLTREYQDAVARATRLEVLQTYTSGDSGLTPGVVLPEDCRIYMRATLAQFQTGRDVALFCNIIRWKVCKNTIEVYRKMKDLATKATAEKPSMWGRMRQKVTEKSAGAANPMLNLTKAASILLGQQALAGTETFNIPLNVSAYTALAPRLDRLMEVHGVSFGLNSRKRTLKSNADELELFFHVSRLFQPQFESQIAMRRTKVYVQSSQSDDPMLSEAARVRMKIEDQSTIYLKKADWVDNRVLYPTIDPAQEARTTALSRFRLDHGIDEVLSVETNFCERDDIEFARLTLKQRAEITREPIKTQSSKVASHVEGELYTAQGWKTVYKDGGGSGKSSDGSKGGSSKLRLGSLAPVAEKDDDSSVQGVAGGKAVAGTKDALLSYCYLRLLEVRQSKLQVRQYLNMFRSIERTLMLDLSATDPADNKSPGGEDSFLADLDKVVHGHGVDNHDDYYQTTKDGIVQVKDAAGLQILYDLAVNDLRDVERELLAVGTHFIQKNAKDDDNIDTQKAGKLHKRFGSDDSLESMRSGTSGASAHSVQSARSARSAMSTKSAQSGRSTHTMRSHVASAGGGMDDDGVSLTSATGLQRKAADKHATKGGVNLEHSADFDMEAYAQNHVDRAGVLMDLWNLESQFQAAKAEVMDLYFTAYLHSWDHGQRTQLAQAMADLMYRRPRHDLEADYLVQSYERETQVLKKLAYLLSKVSKTIMTKKRSFRNDLGKPMGKIDTLSEAPDTFQANSTTYGMDPKLDEVQPILLHSSRGRSQHRTNSAPTPCYLLEFCPELGQIVDIANAVKFAVDAADLKFDSVTTTELQRLDLAILEIADDAWQSLNITPMTPSKNTEQTLGMVSTEVLDNPYAISAIVDAAAHGRAAPFETPATDKKGGSSTTSSSSRGGGGGGDAAKPEAAIIKAFCTGLDMVTCWHRLYVSYHETLEVVGAYENQAKSIGLDISFAHLRPLPFKRVGGLTGGGDVDADAYVPGKMALAVFDIDDPEGQFGAMSVRTLENFDNMLRASIAAGGGGPLGQMRCLLQSQLATLYASTAAVEHREISGDFTDSDAITVKDAVNAVDSGESVLEHVRELTSFVSLRGIKAAARTTMHAEYKKRKGGMSGASLEALELQMMGVYNRALMDEAGKISLRTQSGRYVRGLKRLLDGFPSTRDYYFQVGDPNQVEQKQNLEAAAEQATTADGDHRPVGILKKVAQGKTETEMDQLKAAQKQRSPLQLLSDDGTTLANPWYLPYELELSSMFEKLDTPSQLAALRKVLEVVFRIHDILMILCAHAKLGSSHARLGTQDVAFIGVGADWGGTEGIGAELRQLRRNLRFLSDPTDPVVVANFFEQRRQNVFLEWVLTSRYYVLETFLSKGNQRAYDTVLKNSRAGMEPLGSTHRTQSLAATESSKLPKSISSPRHTKLADKLFPWRTSIATNGPYVGSFFFSNVGSYLELCLTGLDDVERHIANGEVLGISLLMEDIVEQEAGGDEKLDEDPLRMHTLTQEFLLHSLRLEQLKHVWCWRTLGIQVNSPSRYQAFISAYDAQIVGPVVRVCKEKMRLKEEAEGELAEAKGPQPEQRATQRSTAGLLVGQGTALQLHGIPESAYRVLLIDAIASHLECMFISASRGMVRNKQMAALSEMSRFDGEIPTDLWAAEFLSSKSGGHSGSLVSHPTEIASCSIAQDFSIELMKLPTVQNTSSTEVDAAGGDLKTGIVTLVDSSSGGGMGESRKMIAFDVEQFQSALSKLATTIMTREKTTYLAYASQYQIMSQQLEHQLMKKEADIEVLQHKIEVDDVDFRHTIKCELADRSRDHIAEITALRAKVSRMRSEQETQAYEIRERVKQEYDDLVNSLFSTSFSLKNRFEEYRCNLYEDVVESLCDIRKHALTRLKLITVGSADAESKHERGIRHAENLRDVQSENSMLSVLVLKMRTMNEWKRIGVRSFYGKKIFKARAKIPLSNQESARGH